MLIPRSPQTRLSIDSFNLIRAKLDAILSQQSTQKAWIKGNARILPPLSKKLLDQLELNQSIILSLCLSSDWLLSSLDGLTEGVRIYKLAINALESFKVGPEERDYKEAYKRLDLELQETTLNSLGLLKIVDGLLLRLDSPNQEKWKVKEVILEKCTNQLRELPDDCCNEIEEEDVTIEMKITENNTVEIGRMLQNNLLETYWIMKSYKASSSGGFDYLVNSSLLSETDLNVLEGGRDDSSVEKVRQKNIAGQDNKLKTFEVQEMVIKFSEVEGIEELKTEDGRAVLNTARNNGMVRGHLNKLPMNLRGLADQVSNELSLLTWINGEPEKLFESTSKEIILDLE
ncbi:hypothetical protein PPACK8108_LOCUS8436 [Phakopsora pachyrhizi]|uniref:Uncharacterized protein n=1 Tax=Phakopsora pachyrhizi TaxID=170000 RepID=A0AAV0AY46_PHAPC|nr:hypothetical protein PPACK8108_LOCUS8436 [Phakopsora pachyrhizi]